MMPMFVGLAFDSRGFDWIPRLLVGLVWCRGWGRVLQPEKRSDGQVNKKWPRRFRPGHILGLTTRSKLCGV
jgi:hypothetical protein